MSGFLSNRWVIGALRMSIGAVFVYAGVMKWMDPAQFADNIASFRILPDSAINVLAMGLPPTEILAGLMMIFGWHHLTANLAILMLTAIFAVALAQGLARGLQIDCGCFGVGEPSPIKTWISLGRDILLFAVSLMIYMAGLRLPQP
jgi:putative oxidoreductase